MLALVTAKDALRRLTRYTKSKFLKALFMVHENPFFSPQKCYTNNKSCKPLVINKYTSLMLENTNLEHTYVHATGGVLPLLVLN